MILASDNCLWEDGKCTSCRNSLTSSASQDSIEGVLNQFEFTHAIDEFELIKNGEGSSRVGDGGFGSVDKYRHEELGDVVIKKIRFRINNDFLQTMNTFESFSREVKVLQRIFHENIVTFYGTTRVSDDVVGIIMEYVDGTSLQCLLKKQGSKLPWIVRFLILYQISKALKQLHRYKKNKWLVHSDLKPQNIMITDDWQVKLIDFGSINFGKTAAASQDSLDHLKSGQKTEIYAAPEILVCSNGNRVPGMDIYSYGMVIYEVLTGKEVYSDANCSRNFVLEAIKNGVRPNTKHLDKIQTSLKVKNRDDDQVIFENLRSLAEACWEQDPENRPTIEEVMEHLEETFQKVTGSIIDDCQLLTHMIDQAILSMSLEDIISCLRNNENLSETKFADLIRNLSSQLALEDKVYNLVMKTSLLFMDQAMQSSSLQDVQNAFDLWSNVPDLKRAEQGLKICKDHWKNSLTRFQSQVLSLSQTAQKTIERNSAESHLRMPKDRPVASRLELHFQTNYRKNELRPNEGETFDEENDVLERLHAPPAYSSAANESSVLLIEQPEELSEEGDDFKILSRDRVGTLTSCRKVFFRWLNGD